MKRILVTGAGGFIAHHLVKRLKGEGYWVRGVDMKYPEYEHTEADEFGIVDLRDATQCDYACRGVEEVYHLAADMGGIGYISNHHASIVTNNVLMNTYMLEASTRNAVGKFLFSSSACVYAKSKQTSTSLAPLKESDSHPADPEFGYGWEKLFTEQMVNYYREDYGLDTRIVRFHNIYGPLGTYDGGREKSIAALCRKIALAADKGHIEVWGDGRQTRSYTYIDDCIEGIRRLMDSDFTRPLNLGRDELVSIATLAEMIAEIAGKRLYKDYNYDKPEGVRGRNCDTTLLEKVLGWKPPTPLYEGLKPTYHWIESQVNQNAPVHSDRSSQ